jgi:predicted ATPase with chaperone activity
MKFEEIYASPYARRAVEVALAGEHSIMFIGRWQSAGGELVQYIVQQDEYGTAHFCAPCPCGFWGSEVKECTCTVEMAVRWQAKHFSERHPYDIYLDLPDDDPNKVIDFLTGRQVFEPEEKMLARIEDMPHYNDLSLDKTSEMLLKAAIRELHIPARTARRVIRVARTIANLARSEKIQTCHLAEAIQYRPGRRYSG